MGRVRTTPRGGRGEGDAEAGRGEADRDVNVGVLSSVLYKFVPYIPPKVRPPRASGSLA